MILPLMMEIVVKRERSQREKESLDRDIIPKWKCLFQSQWKFLRLIFIVIYKIFEWFEKTTLKLNSEE